MALKWHEFQSWFCEACGTETIILEREDEHLDNVLTISGNTIALKTDPSNLIFISK